MNDELVLRRLVNELPKYRYRFHGEKELHDGIAAVLDGIGLKYERERVASKEDRFDFLLEGGVVIEAKVAGSLGDANRQVVRYCRLECVRAIALVTTKRWDRVGTRGKFNGKKIAVIHVQRQAV